MRRIHPPSQLWFANTCFQVTVRSASTLYFNGAFLFISTTFSLPYRSPQHHHQYTPCHPSSPKHHANPLACCCSLHPARHTTPRYRLFSLNALGARRKPRLYNTGRRRDTEPSHIPHHRLHVIGVIDFRSPPVASSQKATIPVHTRHAACSAVPVFSLGSWAPRKAGGMVVFAYKGQHVTFQNGGFHRPG